MVAKGKVIGRILGLYLGVLIPTLLCSLLMAKSAFRQVEQQEEQRMQIILQDVVSELSNWSVDFYCQSISLGEMREMSPTIVLSDTLNAEKAIRQLSHARVFDRRTEDIVVYYGVGKAYTAQGIVNKRTYFDISLNCMKESADRGMAAMAATARSVTLLRTNSKSDLLMYHFPIRKYAPGYSFSVQFVVALDSVTKVFETYTADNQLMFCLAVGEEKAYFQVADGQGHILNEDMFIEWQDYGNVVRLSQSLEDMEVTLYFDPQVSWSQLQSFQTKNTLLLVLGMLLSTLLSFVFSYHRWGRFKSLTGNLRVEPHPGQKKKVFLDEFDYIKIMLEQSERVNEQVDQNAQMYRHAMLRQAAMIIFHGMVTKPEAIRQVLYTCGLDLCEEYYYLCGVILEEDTDIRKFEHIFDDCLYCESAVNGKMVLLFLTDSSTIDQDCAGRLERADRIRRDMLAIGVSGSCFAMSQIYDSLSMVNYAYLEVISLLENPMQPEGLIECWDKHLRFSSDRLSELQSEQLESFLENLEQRNLDGAQRVLTSILEEDASNSAESHCYIRYCIRQSMILAVRGEAFEGNDGLMSKIMSVNPVDEIHFYERVQKILQSICGSDKRWGQLDEAVLYVKENYCRYDLSLEEVSNYVGISKTQMSKQFKAQLGINYLDFLTQLRMDKARELLLGTDESVKNILLSVGYIDKTSFTKKFKTYFGMSPTEYRSRQQGGGQEDAGDTMEI